jgi:hypothetical protein
MPKVKRTPATCMMTHESKNSNNILPLPFTVEPPKLSE